MHSKPHGHKAATYPLTIQTPFGVLRMAYEYDLEPCPDCGRHHASVALLDASPRLKTSEALSFLDGLPDVLAAAGELAFINSASAVEHKGCKVALGATA